MSTRLFLAKYNFYTCGHGKRIKGKSNLFFLDSFLIESQKNDFFLYYVGMESHVELFISSEP